MKLSQEQIRIRAVWELKTWIRNHLGSVPSVDELAVNVGLSTRTFHRVFKQVTGAPPAEYIQRLRLSLGASWLAYTNVSVIEAAVASGYDSREAFTRQFKLRYGCTPIEFRGRARQHIQEKATLAPPKEVRILGMETLPSLSLLACPHFGAPLSSLSAWVTLSSWAKREKTLSSSVQPASIIYDDALTLPPGSQERYDAALVSDSPLFPEHTEMFIRYTLPAGLYAIAEYTGSLFYIEAAWDYFALSWFLSSGLQMRESRCLTFYDPDDMPTTPFQAVKLMGGQHLRCKMYIPADNTPGNGLPII